MAAAKPARKSRSRRRGTEQAINPTPVAPADSGTETGDGETLGEQLSSVDSVSGTTGKPEPPENTRAGEDAAEDRIILDPVITIAEAANLYNSLLPYTRNRSAISLDASQVQHVDLAGMQLLVVFVKSIKASDRKVTWTGISGVFRQSAELLGLSETLDL